MMEGTSLLIVEKGADDASVIMLCRRSAIMGHIGGVKNPRRGSGRGADAGPPTAQLRATVDR